MLNSFRNYRKLSLMPMIGWLFVQLVLTGMFLPASASTDGGWAGYDASNTIIICTASGFKQVNLNADGTLAEELPDWDNHCPWCIGFGNLPLLLSPELAYLIQFSSISDADWLELSADQAKFEVEHYFRSRAPPFYTDLNY